jgi:hypothetical protein
MKNLKFSKQRLPTLFFLVFGSIFIKSVVIFGQSTYMKKINNKVDCSFNFKIGEEIFGMGGNGFPKITNFGKGDTVMWSKDFNTGRTLDLPELEDTTKYFISNIGYAVNENTIFSGQFIRYLEDSVYKPYIFIAKMNTKGDTLGHWKISMEKIGINLMETSSMAIYKNQVVISATASYPDNIWKYDSVLLWFDLDGIFIEITGIPNDGIFNIGGQLKIGHDGYLYWLTLHDHTTNENDRSFNLQLNRIDGARQNTKFWQSEDYSNSTINVNMEFTLLKDHGFVIRIANLENMYNSTINRYGKSGSLMWTYTFDDKIRTKVFRKILEMENGDLLLYGFYNDYFFNIFENTQYHIEFTPFVCRMSSEGKILWERIYINTYRDFDGRIATPNYNLALDAFELDDGNIYIRPSFSDLIIKTDANGCIGGECKKYYELID